MHVFVTAWTRYGRVRLRLTTNQWEAARAYPAREKSRSHIAIKVKKRLNAAGATKLVWLSWNEIHFSNVSSRGPEFVKLHSPQDAFDSEVRSALEWAEEQSQPEDDPDDSDEQGLEDAAELFPERFGLTPAAFPSDLGCGCVPSPITRR
mgnify:CR=1 FL=1